MRRLQLVLYFFTLCFNVVHLGEFDENKQIQFLQDRINVMKCWTDTDVLSRTVLIDGKPTSINNLFQVSSATYLSTWPITRRNVNEVSRLMKTVMSCEYVELIHSLLAYLKKHLNNCLKLSNDMSSDSEINIDEKNNANHDFEDFRKCVEQYFLVLLKIPDNIKNMMFTLVGFENFRHNFVSGKQEFLKMLLSWNLNLKQYESMQFPETSIGMDDTHTARNKKKETINMFIDTIRSIVIQMEVDIKEFSFQYCQNESEFMVFVNSLDNNSDKNQISAYLNEIPLKLLNYISLDHLVDSLASSSHEQLLAILRENQRIRMPWNADEWLSLPDIYEVYIETSLVTQDVLRYEKAFLDLMTKLVHCRMVIELKSFFEIQNYQILHSKLANISDTFDDFITYIKSCSLPMTFYNDMLELSYQMHTIILYLTSNEHSRRAEVMFDRLQEGNMMKCDKSRKCSNIEESEELDDGLPILSERWFNFLNHFIGKYINSSNLNRDLVNLIFDKAYVTMTRPFEYAVDFKNIFMNGEPKQDQNDETCQTNLPTVENTSKIVFKSVVTFYNAVKNYTESVKNDLLVEQNLNSFRRDVFDFKKAVIRLFIKANYDNVHGLLRKLLLTVILNVENVRLFGKTTEWFLNSERLKSLISFLSNCTNLITKYHQLVCLQPTGDDDEHSSAEDNQSLSSSSPSHVTVGGSNLDIQDYVNTFYSEIDKQDVHLVLHESTSELGFYLNSVKMYRDLVSSTLVAFDGRLIKFMWNGRRTRFLDIHAELEYRAFEIQGLVEYQYMTVKWIVCSLLSAVLNILNGIVFYGVDPVNVLGDGRCLIGHLNYLILLPMHFFTPRDVTVVFEDFLNIIMGGGTEDANRNLRTFVMDQLMMFGVVLTTMPNSTEYNLFDYVNRVCKNVDLLQKQRFGDLFDTIGFKKVLRVEEKVRPTRSGGVMINKLKS